MQPAYNRVRYAASAFVVALLTTLSTGAYSGTARPLVFVPGILGTKLCSTSGSVVWGDVDSYSNIAQLDTLAKPPQPLHTCGLIERVDILGPFFSIHQYDSLLKTFAQLEYVKDRDLFVFEYDWRLSNELNAKLLGEWVNANATLRGTKFDIVAHSMGGLITRTYLNSFDGAPRVRKVVYLGTPFQGSMNSLAMLSDGWGLVQNALGGGINTVRGVVLSMPSMYELFPDYQFAACCRIGPFRSATAQPFDLYAPDEWRQRDWLPPEYKSGDRADFFNRSLANAKRLHATFRAMPANVEEVRIAGAAKATRLYLYVPREQQSWKDWRITADDLGDGTVPIWSAANGSDLAGTDPSFSVHATIFDDKWVAEKLKRELVPTPPPPVAGRVFNAVSTQAGIREIELVDSEVVPAVADAASPVLLRIEARFKQAAAKESFYPSVVLLIEKREVPVLLTDVSTAKDISSRIMRFEGRFTAPKERGAYQVNIRYAPEATDSAFFNVR